MDNLYDNLSDVKNDRIRTLLSDNRELAYISKKLVALKDDVNLNGLKITPFVFNKTGALEFVRNTVESKSLFEKISKNLIVQGIAGSGKSTGVARLLTAVLKQQNSDLKIVALSTIEQRHKDIAKTVGTEIHGSIDTLFDEIFIDENGRKIKYDKEKYGPKPKFSTNEDDPQIDHYDPSENLKRNQMRNDAALASDSQNVLYLIDEVTQLTEDQLIVLAEYVKKLRENGINAFIVGLGDSTQSHAYDKDAETTTNISTCTYLSTPQLSVSLRKANRGIRDNNQKLEK